MRPRTPPRHRSALTAAALACAAFGGSGLAQAQFTEVVPGVTYERLQQPGQVVHVVRVVQGPLISVRPVLTAGAPSRRAPLTRAMGDRLGEGAVIGINGDYFNLDNAYPSGLMVSDGELVNEPEPTRSALVFPAAGPLTTAKFQLVGTWQASDPAIPTPFPERGFIGVNRPAERANEGIVYTPRYGDVTPIGDRVDAVITMDTPGGPATNRPLTGTVTAVTPGGGVVVRPGQLVLSGAGTAGDNIVADLIPGRRITLTFKIDGLAPDTLAAIGGGPALVQNGVPLSSVSEGFSNGQITTRTSRSAIGQTADGTVLLVTAEERFQGSNGISMVEQAQLMANLGAQTAVGMDGGGSAIMALRTTPLVRWTSERSITNAVVVSYAGVQLTQPPPFLSPNGDGVDDRGATTVRASKPGSVRVALARANGRTIKNLYSGPIGPAGRQLALDRTTLTKNDGTFRIIARFRPDDGSSATNHTQTLAVDRTLGFLRTSKTGKAPKQKARITFKLARTARVTVTIKNAGGSAVKLIYRNRRLRAGSHAALWDMKRKGKPIAPGAYTVFVSVGTPSKPTLSSRVKVTAVPTPTPPPAEPVSR